jgi:hypothetical protein
MSTFRPLPSGKPASARSFFAAAGSKPQLVSPLHAKGISHGVKKSATVEPAGKKFLTIWSRSMPWAIAWRTRTSSNGFWVLLKPRNSVFSPARG